MAITSRVRVRWGGLFDGRRVPRNMGRRASAFPRGELLLPRLEALAKIALFGGEASHQSQPVCELECGNTQSHVAFLSFAEKRDMVRIVRILSGDGDGAPREVDLSGQIKDGVGQHHRDSFPLHFQ